MRARSLVVPSAAACLGLLTFAPPGQAAPPPCGGVAQISDAANDGHHPNTDLLAAWFSEASGRLQAVIQPRTPSWAPVHDDSDEAGFALLYDVGGVRQYVRARAIRNGSPAFDRGTWTPAGGFVSAGPATGVLEAGHAVIDVPAPAAGTVLRQPFALTYDGFESGQPHWVDRGPGGTTPTDGGFGADFTVGACALAGGGGSGGGAGGTGAGGGPATPGTTAVVLTAPARVTGSAKARISGRVVPARAGVAVTVTRRAGRRSKGRSTLTTRADGSYATTIAVGETLRVDAVAAGVNAQTRTITVRSKVTLKLTKVGRRVRVSGTVSPKLGGRVLILRDSAVVPTVTTTARLGRFAVAPRAMRRGRYEAVFIPSGKRAERSTSKQGRIR